MTCALEKDVRYSLRTYKNILTVYDKEHRTWYCTFSWTKIRYAMPTSMKKSHTLYTLKGKIITYDFDCNSRSTLIQND